MRPRLLSSRRTILFLSFSNATLGFNWAWVTGAVVNAVLPSFVIRFSLRMKSIELESVDNDCSWIVMLSGLGGSAESDTPEYSPVIHGKLVKEMIPEGENRGRCKLYLRYVNDSSFLCRCINALCCNRSLPLFLY